MGTEVYVVSGRIALRMRRLATVIIGTVLFFSCGVKKTEPVSRMDFKVCHNTSDPDISYMVLDVPEDIFLGNIDQLDADGNCIYILSSTTATAGVYVFEKDTGRYVSRIGNRGRGHGEYMLPLSFTIVGDRIFVVDGGMASVLEYSLVDFKYIDKKGSNDISYFDMVDDSICLSDNPVYTKKNEDFRKFFMLRDLSFGPIEGYVDKVLVSGYSTGPAKPMYRYGDRIRAYTQSSPIIYEYDRHEMRPVLRVSFQGLEFPPEDFLMKISRNGRDYTEDLRNSGYISYFDFHETPDNAYAMAMAGGKRYVGMLSKTDWNAVLLAEHDFGSMSWFMPMNIIGTIGNAMVVAKNADELNTTDKEIPENLAAVLDKCQENDIVLQCIIFKS